MAKTAAAPKPEPMIGGGLRMEATRKERAPKKHHIDHISIHKAKGGVTVRHHHAYMPGSGMSEPDKDHVFTNDQFHSHLVPHLQRHLGMKKADAAEKAENETPAEEKAETPEEEAGETA